MIEPIIILLLITVISVLTAVFTLGKNKDLRDDIDILEDKIKTLELQKARTFEVENKKTDIRNEANEKKNDIYNSNGATDGIMYNRSETKLSHNHNYNQPCGKNCPAYSE